MLQAIHSFYPPPTTEGSSTEENPLVLSQVTPQGRASIPPPPLMHCSQDKHTRALKLHGQRA